MRPNRIIASVFLCGFLSIFVGASSSGAATHCVNPGGTGGCFSTVQEAVDAAGKDDVVDVAAGTYAETVLIPASARLTIMGAGPADTVIDRIIADDKAKPILSGFTATGIVGQIRSRISASNFVVSGGTRGVYLSLRARASLSDCTISGHEDYGISGLAKNRVVVERCTVSNNGFGALPLQGAGGIVAARVELRDSVVHGNSGVGVAAGRALIENSTISGTTHPWQNSGLGVNATRMILRSSTVAGNSFGISSSKKPLLANTILSNGTDCVLPAGARSLGHNLVGAPSGCGLVGGNGTDIVGVSALLAPLADNGGPTHTHALLGGSPAIGAGGPLDSGTKKGRCPATDQRGTARSGACDIGAYEKVGGSPSGAFIDPTPWF